MLEISISRLPQPIQVFIDGVEIRFADYPAIEDLLENYPPLSPFTDALYRGRPPNNDDPWTQRPQWITLFQGNLSRPTNDHDTIVQRIAEALMHEAMHWLGLSEMPT
jgi:predicted Zn-dependent protease with MMP-like domain